MRLAGDAYRGSSIPSNETSLTKPNLKTNAAKDRSPTSVSQSDDPQIAPTSPADNGRNSASVLREFSSLASDIRKSVVQIHNQDGLRCLGTIISSHGLVVTKHSEATGTVQCIAYDEVKRAGNIIAVHPQLDLALVQINSPGTSFSNSIDLENAGELNSGILVLSVGQSSELMGMGVITAAIQSFPIEQPKCRDCVDLGLTVARTTASRQVAAVPPST